MCLGALLSCGISAVLSCVLCLHAHLCSIWSDALEGHFLDNRRVGLFVPDCNGTVASHLGVTFKEGCSAGVRRRSHAAGLLLVVSDTQFFRFRAAYAGQYQNVRRVPLPGSASLLWLALVYHPAPDFSLSLAVRSIR